jgi:hypothetical protein
MPLDYGRAVSEEDAEELEGEEAKVEMHRREEGEEGVQGRSGGEEDVGVAKSRIIANGLQWGVAEVSERQHVLRSGAEAQRTLPSISSTSQSKLNVSTTALAISTSSGASSCSTPSRMGSAREPTSCICAEKVSTRGMMAGVSTVISKPESAFQLYPTAPALPSSGHSSPRRILQQRRYLLDARFAAALYQGHSTHRLPVPAKPLQTE